MEHHTYIHRFSDLSVETWARHINQCFHKSLRSSAFDDLRVASTREWYSGSHPLSLLEMRVGMQYWTCFYRFVALCGPPESRFIKFITLMGSSKTHVSNVITLD